MWINRTVFVVLTFLLSGCRCCVKFSDGWKEVSLEERAKRASVVFHGLAIESLPVAGDQSSYAVQFWLINVYKGSEDVGKFLNLYPGSGGVFNLRDRKINVTGFSYKSKCQGVVASQKYYIIFSELLGNELAAKFDDLFGASAEWSETNERRIWHAVGWENWSDWGPCSASCGEGSQERTRRCFLEDNDCRGYNKERRRCNMFSCQGAVDALRLDDQRYFHPSRGEWQRVADRPTAWKLRLNSYIWLPSSQLFRNKTTSRRFDDFPREFSLLITLKLNPKKLMRGTLFSLRSRRQQNAYLSLELESPDRVRVVHSGKNGTPAVVIPMKLNDGHWHQMSIALQDDNSVRSFLDCSWISTDILKRNELDHPEDADLIIGYLFQGSLEQLMIVPNPGAVAQQCSSTKIPIFDKDLLESDSGATTTVTTSNSEGKGKQKFKGKPEKDGRNQNLKKYKYLAQSKELPKGKLEPDSYEDKDWFIQEGSGRGSSLDKAFYEVEWSEWSACSSTCGDGMQSRYSRCVDDGSQLELCLEAGIERTEMRSCHLQPCHPFPVSVSMESHAQSGNTTTSVSSNEQILSFGNLNRTHHNGTVLDRKHHVRKAHGKKVPINRSWDLLKRQLLRENGSKKNWCSCLNGGTCVQKGNSCRCPEGYWGRFCENVSCQVSCLNGGQCLEGNVCGCLSGFSGSRCENPICDPPCRNGGTCIEPDVCLCPPQTTGSYCQKYYCSAPCLNGGSCVGPDQCECPHNATGKNCENPVCEPPCENGATCSSGNWCLCSPSSYGIRCERRKCEYVAVKVPFTKGFKRLIAKSNGERKCETLPWKTCENVVPEYQTVYKTFYKTVYKCREDLLKDEKHPK